MIDIAWREKIYRAINDKRISDIKSLLSVLDSFLESIRKEKNWKHYKEGFVVSGIFQKPESFNEGDYEKATFQAICDFNIWLIGCCDSEPECVFCNTGRFIHELASYIPALGAWTATTTLSVQAFNEVNSLFLSGRVHGDIIRYIFIAFGIRQILESKFKRILGVICILANNRPVRIKHSLIPDFLFSEDVRPLYECFDSQNYSPLWKIYAWTNISIHNMCAPKCWEIWLALKHLRNFISPPPTNSSVIMGGHSWNIHGKITIKKENYLELRDRFGKYLATQLQKDITVIFDNMPEICIIDDSGHYVNVDSSTINFPYVHDAGVAT